MLQVNLSDGQTLQFNMEQEGDAQRWERLSADPAFQRSIRAAAILWEGRQYVIPSPGHFNRVDWEHELVMARDGERINGERLVTQADEVRTILTVWRRQRGDCKVESVRVGRRVHDPRAARMPEERTRPSGPDPSPSDRPATAGAVPRARESA